MQEIEAVKRTFKSYSFLTPKWEIGSEYQHRN